MYKHGFDKDVEKYRTSGVDQNFSVLSFLNKLYNSIIYNYI